MLLTTHTHTRRDPLLARFLLGEFGSGQWAPHPAGQAPRSPGRSGWAGCGSARAPPGRVWVRARARRPQLTEKLQGTRRPCGQSRGTGCRPQPAVLVRLPSARRAPVRVWGQRRGGGRTGARRGQELRPWALRTHATRCGEGARGRPRGGSPGSGARGGGGPGRPSSGRPARGHSQSGPRGLRPEPAPGPTFPGARPEAEVARPLTSGRAAAARTVRRQRTGRRRAGRRPLGGGRRASPRSLPGLGRRGAAPGGGRHRQGASAAAPAAPKLLGPQAPRGVPSRGAACPAPRAPAVPRGRRSGAAGHTQPGARSESPPHLSPLDALLGDSDRSCRLVRVGCWRQRN